MNKHIGSRHQPIRGDGNCFFRAFWYSLVDSACVFRDFSQVNRVLTELTAYLDSSVHPLIPDRGDDGEYIDTTDAREYSLDRMGTHLQSIRELTHDEMMRQTRAVLDENRVIDLGLVALLRAAGADYLKKNPTEEVNGMSFEALGTAETMTDSRDGTSGGYPSFVESCRTMGRYVHYILYPVARGRLFKIGVRVNHLAGHELTTDYSATGMIDVHLLYKPGHFDAMQLNPALSATGSVQYNSKLEIKHHRLPGDIVRSEEAIFSRTMALSRLQEMTKRGEKICNRCAIGSDCRCGADEFDPVMVPVLAITQGDDCITNLVGVEYERVIVQN